MAATDSAPSPALMRAMVLEEVGGLPRLTQTPAPEAGPHEALVRVEACGVGLTVRDKFWRIGSDQLPRIPGHELAGIVVEVGPEVRDLSVGDRVVAYYYMYCGECHQCRRGRQNLCARDERRIGEHVDGGYADYVALPAKNLFRIPGDVGSVEATVACDALATPVHVCNRAGVGRDSRVLVIGAAGGVGIHLVQVAKDRGADVLGVDIGSAKVRALEGLGVRAVDASAGDWTKAASDGVDLAVDFVGTAETFTRAYSALDQGGQLMRMVTYRDVSVAQLAPGIGVGERSISGSRYCTVDELGHALQLLAQRRVKAIVSAVEPMEGFKRVAAKLDDRTLIGRAAVVM